MYGEEIDPVDVFIGSMVQYIDEETYWPNYGRMDEEKRAKYAEKLVFHICVIYAPMRNYGITKNEIREWVKTVLKVGLEVDGYE